MNKSVLIKGGILVFLFASIVPVTLFWIGDAVSWPDLLIISVRKAIGVLITLGLPLIWLAWRSKKFQQPVFMNSQSKMVLLLATIITALSVASMYNFSVVRMLPLFPLGLWALLAYNGTLFDESLSLFSIMPIIGWITYLGISLFIIFTKNRRAAQFLYLILVALLMANIGGCTQMLAAEAGSEGW